MTPVPAIHPSVLPGLGFLRRNAALLYLLDDFGAVDVRDASENALHGQLQGSPTWVSGPYGPGLSFPGNASDYIQACAAGEAASPDVVQFGSFTVEFVGRHADESGTWSWAIGEAGGGAFIFGKEAGTGLLHAWLEGQRGGTTYGTGYSVADGEVHHCLLTHDWAGERTQVYVDGEQVGDEPNNLENTNYGAGLRIGARQDAFSEPWNGDLYLVALYAIHISPRQALDRTHELRPYLA